MQCMICTNLLKISLYFTYQLLKCLHSCPSENKRNVMHVPPKFQNLSRKKPTRLQVEAMKRELEALEKNAKPYPPFSSLNLRPTITTVSSSKAPPCTITTIFLLPCHYFPSSSLPPSDPLACMVAVIAELRGSSKVN
ncbi:hypothetical protein RJT34_17971 [Clitoria ternatea]|uniref:Uncharacterized protein n=1 Tax=Clitoria ternatea TaxID=43366 RepID=A0AAN9PDS9_CLITE